MEKRKLRSKATHFTMIGEELYGRDDLLEGSPMRIFVSEEDG